MPRSDALGAALRQTHRWGIAAVRHGGPTRRVAVYRYGLPPGLSWAGCPGRLEIPLAKITTATGFSFGEHAWHPHVETMRWHARRRSAAYDVEETPLARLYSVFRPCTVREAIFDDLPDPIPGLSDVPLVRGQLRELWNPYGHRPLRPGATLDRPGLYWGPAAREYVASEIERTRTVHDGLARAGLRDNGPGKDAISGYLLVRGDDYRFVVHQGHHRLACLTVLGHAAAPVYLSSRVAPVIDTDRLGRWTAGARARYQPSTARLLFARLFDSCGIEKAERLGLLRDADQRTRDS